MEIEKKLEKVFPGHTIQLRHQHNSVSSDRADTPVCIGAYSIFYDGNLLRTKYKDWSEEFKLLDNRDHSEEMFQNLVTAIKLELSRLPKNINWRGVTWV